MAKQCFHAVVSGRVQGVFFRSNTQKQAKLLQLTGWVKNLRNGDVELIACGEEGNLNKLREWLALGPPRARVTDVRVDYEDWQDFLDFSIKY